MFYKETKSYEIIFHIPSSYDFEDEFYYNYNLKNNTFKQIEVLTISYFVLLKTSSIISICLNVLFFRL